MSELTLKGVFSKHGRMLLEHRRVPDGFARRLRTATPSLEWEQLEALPSIAVGVDRAKAKINGLVMAQAGPFKTPGRGQFNRDSLQAIARLVNAMPDGVASRWTHGPENDPERLGDYLGQIRNPYITIARNPNGDVWPAVRGELTFSKAAFKSPTRGDMANYLLDLAEEHPAALASSLVLKADMQPMAYPEPDLWMPTEIGFCDIVSTGEAVDSIY